MKVFFSSFGSIKRAELEIKPLTVIASKNETEKSFILRALYLAIKRLKGELGCL